PAPPSFPTRRSSDLHSRPGDEARRRLYRVQDIERLIERRESGHSAAQGAAHSLAWGLPVLETRVSLIRAEGPYYRGRPVSDLIRSEEHTSELQSREN